MGMRKYYRAIAKARLTAMGADQVNRKMGPHISRSRLAEAFRCFGTANRAKLREYMSRVMWRRVLWGDLAKDGRKAQFARRHTRAKMSRKAVRAVRATVK